MKECYKIKIEPLTAVHIGTGNSLSLLDYKLSKTSSGLIKYVRFSSDSILNRIATDEKLRHAFEAMTLNNDMKSTQQKSVFGNVFESCEECYDYLENKIPSLRHSLELFVND